MNMLLTLLGTSGGYSAIYNQISDLITFFFVQFYNQVVLFFCYLILIGQYMLQQL